MVSCIHCRYRVEKVWVLEWCIPYEGCALVSVHHTQISAMAAGDAAMEEDGYEPSAWAPSGGKDHLKDPTEYTMGANGTNNTYQVRLMEVK